MEHVASPAPPGLAPDPLWRRAGAWLDSGPQGRPVDLAVIGIPAFRTSLSPTGAAATPAAVRQALWRFSTAAPSRDADLSALAPFNHGDLPDPDSDEDATTARVSESVANARLTVAIGGDNSITYAVARGAYATEVARAGLVTLDAHHDVRDGINNGSPVRRLVEAGLDPTRIVQIGIADFANSPAYSARTKAWGIRVMTLDDVRRRGMVAVMRDALEIAGRGGGAIHVDLDLDVCDRSVAPGCPASLPGGLAAHELLDAAFLAGLNSQVRTLDIAEVDATADTPDGRTVRLAARCLLEAGAGLARRHA